MVDMATVWERIEAHAGEALHQIRGGAFTYEVQGGAIIPDRINHRTSKGEFEKALVRLPISGPGEIQDLRGPSYVYAILSDQRIRRGDW